MADHRINSLVLAAGPLSSSPTSATKSAISRLMRRSKKPAKIKENFQESAAQEIRRSASH